MFGPFTQVIFVAQCDAVFVALKFHSSFKYVRNPDDIAANKIAGGLLRGRQKLH